MENSLVPPSRLRCEYLVNPIGIDTPVPRFSWYLKHDQRGRKQSAYQIIISSSPENAQEEAGDVWDSGRRESADNFSVSAVGPALSGSTVYYWRVRWWDASGGQSPYSHVSFFETGILNPDDWKASWIGPSQWSTFSTQGTTFLGEYTGDTIQTLAVYLRKEFSVRDGVRVRRARAYVSGLGFYELRLNGERVGGSVLDPAPTDYSKFALYSAKNLTERLSAGLNTAALILGNGRFIKNYGFGPPKAFVQIEIDYADGGRDMVLSDGSWKTAEGPLKENGLYSGETYNAQDEMPGWDQPGFDDSNWRAAVVREPTRLAAQMMQPIRVTRLLPPQTITSPEPGVYIFDFGQNFSGWVKVKAQGPAGTQITIRHAELLNDNGMLNTSPNQNAEAKDTYILRGEGLEEFRPRFTYHGFRYAEISGFPGVPSLDSVEGCFIHTDADPTGEFYCSHDLINRIHRNVLWGQLSNLVGIPTDCPQRDERHGWLAHAHLSAEEAMFNFDLAAFYAKFLEDIRLAQRADGSLPDVVPPYVSRAYPADPAWGSAYPTLTWLVYQYYGDRRVLEKHYPALKKYINFLSNSARHNIIDRLGKYGDWCPPGSIPPKKTPLALTSTWFYIHDVLTLSRIAEALQEREDAHTFLKLSDEIKASFNKAFLSEDGYSTLQTTSIEKAASQTSNVLPLYLGLVPEDSLRLVLKKLLESLVRQQDYHLDTGILGTRYLLDVLTDVGLAETAFKVAVQKSYPGWGYMVEEGATTLWERWEKITGGGMNSHNHIMLGSVDAWFYRTIAGLTCLEPGWRRFRFKPFPFTGLKFATARLHTMKGEIRAGWEKSAKALQLFIQVPVGAEAEVHVPRFWDQSLLFESGVLIWESGQAKDMPPEISYEGQIGERPVFLIQSGFYAFALSPAT
jgi:alpha-L-rhamnosidase